MWWSILAVGVGGFLGAVSRYLISGWMNQRFGGPGFAVGTLTVNLIGCLLIGAAFQLATQRQALGPGSMTFLTAGILGSFTTFSTFSFETLAMVSRGDLRSAGMNLVVSIVLGLAAVWAGQRLVGAF